MRIELSVQPGHSGLQHRGGPWLEVSPCPLVLSGIGGVPRCSGPFHVPGSWLPGGAPFPRPSHRSLVRASFGVSWPRPPLYPPRTTPLPSPFPSPPPPAWSVVRGEGACVSGFGSGPGNFLRRLGLGQRDALLP